MKIIAQSIIAPKVPYIHLGYVAGSHIKGEATTFFTGLLMIGIGFILCCRIFLSKEFLNTIEIKTLQIPGWKWITTGFTCLIIGFFLVHLSEKLGTRIYSYPEEATPRLMENIVYIYSNKYQSAKMSFKEYLDQIPHIEKDPWNKKIHITILKEDPELQVKMASAGPDKNFGTRDDIIREFIITNEGEVKIETKINSSILKSKEKI